MTEIEYFESLAKCVSDAWSKPLYECPKCKKMSVCRDDSIVYTSNPAKYQYKCLEKYDGCGEYDTIR